MDRNELSKEIPGLLRDASKLAERIAAAGPLLSEALTMIDRLTGMIAAQRRSNLRSAVEIIELEKRASLTERNVMVIWVVGDKVSAEFGPHPRESARALRARFGASKSGFRAVLVGKDGGVKLNTASPLGTGAVYATIDAMPMRQNEMRRK